MLEVKRPPEDDEGLPEYIRDRPRYLEWERPTAWLLGVHVLSSLRQLILSAIHTGFDIRDWMTAEPGGIALHHDKQPLECDATDDGAYWFDFVADTGDAPALVYCLGRALQRKKLVVGDGKDATTLPRGRMLIVGGDTAYPVADKTALCERWQAPLVWASRQSDVTVAKPALPIFAIPGNHDYYDALDGFGRQFRKQVTADGVASAKGKPPPLRLPGYARHQSATYFRLKLPFEWEVWGIDLGTKPTGDKPPIDTRQLEYFRDGGQAPPKKLITVTSVPVVVHHAPVAPLVKAYEALGLPPAFTPGSEVPAGSARLDLSGDVHLYERYWGSARAPKDALESERFADAKPCASYAAVVSGLGGAFHHPVQVREGTTATRVQPQSAWPRQEASKAAFGDVLTRPRKVFQAGSVGVLGAILGLVFYLLAHEWSASGILDLPLLLATADTRAASRVPEFGVSISAAETARNFGVTIGFVASLGVWIGFAAFIRWWCSRIRLSAFEPRKQWWWHHALLDRILRKRPFVVFLRWFGANRRVVISVVRRLLPWTLFFVSCYGVMRWEEYLNVGGREAFGTNLAATILLLAMIAFPLITNERWRKPFTRFYTAIPFVLLGLVHGVAQLFAPYLWAEATYLLVAPFALLIGYWCVRPLANELLRKLGKAFGPIWLLLVTGCLGTPLVLMAEQGASGLALAALACWLGVCLVGVLAGAYRLKRRLSERRRDAQTPEETAAFPKVWRAKWAGFATLVWLVFPLQILAIALLEDGIGSNYLAGLRHWVGYGAAAIGGAIFACLWLGWYVLVCLQWGWHGNDAGSVARIDDYAEFLRIKLTADKAEVWAIGVDARETELGDYPATIRLVDHFEVTTKGA
jgi:hypothetical protein